MTPGGRNVGLPILVAIALLPFGKHLDPRLLGIVSVARLATLAALAQVVVRGKLLPVWRSERDYTLAVYGSIALLGIAWLPWAPFLESTSLLSIQSRIALALLAILVAATWTSIARRYWRYTAMTLIVSLAATSYLFPRTTWTAGVAYGGVSRYEGWLGNANEFASASVLGICMLLLSRPDNETRHQRLATIALGVLGAAMVVQSLSRGGLLALAILGLTHITRRLHGLLRLPTIAGTSIAAFLLVPSMVGLLPDTPLVNTWRDRLTGQKNFGAEGFRIDNSIATRQAMLRDSWSAWLDQPIAGHGPGGFPTVAGDGRTAHNILVGEAVEFGILGIVGVLGLGLAIGGALAVASGRTRMVLACGTGLAFYAYGMTSNALGEPQFWVAMGLMVGVFREQSASATDLPDSVKDRTCVASRAHSLVH